MNHNDAIATHHSVLRLNLGDASESRIYYCAHFVARALGLFARHGVEVRFQMTEAGGHTVRGGQIPALLSGEADLAVGGPMVIMKMREENEAHLVAFCAVANANPWVLARPEPGRFASLAELKGHRVRDVACVGTATMAFRDALARAGLAEEDVEIVDGPPPGNHWSDEEVVLHSRHALAEPLAAGELTVWCDLAEETGAVPWSAYIAAPEVLASRPAAFEAFVGAIGEAQRVIANQPAAKIAALIAADYPELSPAALTAGIEGYRESGVIATEPAISAADFERFSQLLEAIGWLSGAADYHQLVDTRLWPAHSAAATQEVS
ncbi:ABC transporter substrate-binding protein [Salinicola avicenniae]|uniref:ABC transporter substrate-binding protein n=1 Tax=Salinicola avicenniae TaxID=2916836 RepID=UPI002073311C|nr:MULTISPECIES: ABC transporter substrate-binding protein [unclassified Salinicola]